MNEIRVYEQVASNTTNIKHLLNITENLEKKTDNIITKIDVNKEEAIKNREKDRLEQKKDIDKIHKTLSNFRAEITEGILKLTEITTKAFENINNRNREIDEEYKEFCNKNYAKYKFNLFKFSQDFLGKNLKLILSFIALLIIGFKDGISVLCQSLFRYILK